MTGSCNTIYLFWFIHNSYSSRFFDKILIIFTSIHICINNLTQYIKKFLLPIIVYPHTLDTHFIRNTCACAIIKCQTKNLILVTLTAVWLPVLDDLAWIFHKPLMHTEWWKEHLVSSSYASRNTLLIREIRGEIERENLYSCREQKDISEYKMVRKSKSSHQDPLLSVKKREVSGLSWTIYFIHLQIWWMTTDLSQDIFGFWSVHIFLFIFFCTIECKLRRPVFDVS